MSEPLPYKVTRGRRRTFCVSLTREGELTVRVPWLASGRDIERFVSSRADWIRRKQAQWAARPRPLATPPRAGDQLAFLGERLTLEVGGVRAARREGSALRVPSGEPAALEACLRRWYRAAAREAALATFAVWCPRVGRSPRELVIREQKTCWGSCSGAGVISLNWRLALGEPEWFEYVVVHELCHLHHRNHSAAFWAEVGRHLPDVLARRAGLRGFIPQWVA